MLSAAYGIVARRRRRWYDARPEKRRRLRCPVVSVGSLTVGGSGKTPVAADVARVLVSMGERPAVLSRGYRRTNPREGVVVVSTWGQLQTDVSEAGDEPFMLARQLPSASVLVATDRYLAGRLAETQLGASVHVLDDGFQHLSLWRDADLLVLSESDLADPRTLPSGRLREPLDAAVLADALVADAPDLERASALASRLGVKESFLFERVLSAPQGEAVGTTSVPDGARVLAVAGIARPTFFVDALKAKGYDVVELLSYRDHHPYSATDVDAIADRARSVGVDYVVTTEKDYVRLEPLAPFPISFLWVPLRVSVQPAESFSGWLEERLTGARDAGAPPEAGSIE